MQIARMNRFAVGSGLVAALIVGTPSRSLAQAPTDAEVLETPGAAEAEAWLPAQTDEEDAAARGLRSLYVPGGLTSEEAVTQVLETSPDLKRTRALRLEAKGGALQAMSALVPRLELLARATKLSPVQTAGIAGGDGDQVQELVNMVQDPAARALWQGLTDFQFPALTSQYATDATLTYSITDSLLEALPAYRAAKDNKKAARQQLDAELNNVAFDARQAYYEFARAKASVGVAESAVEAAEAQRKETAALVAAGAAARVDLMRVDAQLEAAKVALARSQLGFQVAERSLQALMHTEATPALGEDLSEPLPDMPLVGEDALFERALRERPDLQALYTYIDATQHQLRSARGGRVPDLVLRGSAQYSNPNLRVVPQQERFEGTWEATALVRWAPNDTVDAQGRAKRAEAALERAHADAIALSDAIRVEVAQGYHGVLAATAAIESSRLGLSAAEESYRVKREQLQAGIVNTTDLLQAQADLIRAQVDVVDSAVGIRIARAQLLRAIGERP